MRMQGEHEAILRGWMASFLTWQSRNLKQINGLLLWLYIYLLPNEAKIGSFLSD